MKKTRINFLMIIALLVIFSTLIAAQEICNNGIDDDNDSLIDCLDDDCQYYADCADVVPCSNALFQVISGELRIFDPLTSSYEVVGSSSIGSYNGAGYNTEDGFIYGIKSIDGNHNMLKIDAAGLATVLGPIGNWSGISYSADVDQSGNWIGFMGGNNPQLRQIDLDQLPLEMTTTPLNNLSGNAIPNTADISYNPVWNKYYGFSKNYELIEIDPVALTIDIVWSENLSTNNFGAAWSDSEGNTYFSNNATGEISRFTFDSNGIPVNRQVVAYGEITNQNDGMNCGLALPPFETNCSDGIDNDGDGYVDGNDPDCVSPPPLAEVANDPVVNTISNSWGVSAVDYNQDGYADIFVPSYDEGSPNQLFTNNGTGQFVEHTGDDLVADLMPSIAPAWGDFDNDGQIDVAIANNIGNSITLYKNNNQSFQNVSNQIDGIIDGYTHNLSFVDYNRDGWLDLFASDYFASNFNQLYQNNGDGSFKKKADFSIVADADNSLGATWADVNNDGWPDCFIPNYGSSNVLYINQGGQFFSPIYMGDNANSVGASFGDYDNDQDLDLFVPNASNQHNFLYTNDGNGNFTKVESGWVAADKGNSHGSIWADLDNDGWLDLVVMNDADGSKFLYMNNGDGTFGKVTNSPFISPIGNSFAIAAADLELDGDLDLIISNHNNEKNRIFKNNLASGNYLHVRLEGTNSNRSAIGAKILINATINGVPLTLMREVTGQSGGGPGAQSSLIQHFGLGDAATIDTISVHWPSGYVQQINNVGINQLIDIKEVNGALIKGHVFYDSNENCTKDSNEFALANTMINVNSGMFYAITNDSGYYELSLPVGTYTIQQEVPNNYYSNCQATPQSITVNNISQVFEQTDFPNLAISDKPDLSVHLGTTALRRGFDNEMVITVSNDGSANATGVSLELELGSNIELSSASIYWDTLTNDTYHWQIDTIQPGAVLNINLMNYVSLDAVLGEMKNLSATVATNNEELAYDNNTAQLEEMIVGSMDPNDLLVDPPGIGSSHLIDPETRLYYKIRFQNVGNYPASFVIIRDTIKQNFDITSLRLGPASHDYSFKLLSDNVLEWYFEDINLIDSIQNEPESHGFAQFSIQPKVDLGEGTRLSNRASIQFDYNPYIITNICSHKIRYVENVNTGFELKVFPNPATNQIECYLVNADIFASGKVMEDRPYTLDIYNAMGYHCRRLTFEEPSSIVYIDINDLSAGIYYIKYQDEVGTIKTSRFIKQ